jgi:hypothetical protein
MQHSCLRISRELQPADNAGTIASKINSRFVAVMSLIRENPSALADNSLETIRAQQHDLSRISIPSRVGFDSYNAEARKYDQSGLDDSHQPVW